MNPSTQTASEIFPSALKRSLRIALVFRLNPNKIGSIEQWIMKFCSEAKRRGHTVEVITGDDVLPEIHQALESSDAKWRSLKTLTENPVEAWKMLSTMDVLHLNFIGLRECFAIVSYFAFRAKLIWVDHISESVGARRTFLGSLLGLVSGMRLSAVVGVSDFIKTRDSARFFRSTKVTRIYNGVDVERFLPSTRERSDVFRILAAAHLIAEKGIDTLLRAAKGLENMEWHLTVVGVGPELQTLKDLARTLGIDARVTFAGMRNDLDELLRVHDVFVHPAKWQEAFGLTIAEALASGVPTIASRIGAIPELVEDGVTGVLVNPGEPEPLTHALLRVASDRDFSRLLGENARKRAVEKFSLDKCVVQHLELCEEVIGAA